LLTRCNWRQDDLEMSDIGEHEGVRAGLVRMIALNTPVAQRWACWAVCSLGRNAAASEALGRTAGFYDALLACLLAPDDGSNGAYWLRLAACSALASISEALSTSSANAEAMASTPGILEALVAVMDQAGGAEPAPPSDIAFELQDAAAIVLHNASNLENVALRMVSTPGMLSTLKHLALGARCRFWASDGRGDEPELSRASTNAICTINNLAKHRAVREEMRREGLLRGLSQLVAAPAPPRLRDGRGSGGDERAVYVAAAMTSANLCPAKALPGMYIPGPHLGRILHCLRKAAAGEPWQGILWGVCDCALPLAALAQCRENREGLAALGIVPVVVQLLGRWLKRHTSPLPGVRTRAAARRAAELRAAAAAAAGAADEEADAALPPVGGGKWEAGAAADGESLAVEGAGAGAGAAQRALAEEQEETELCVVLATHLARTEEARRQLAAPATRALLAQVAGAMRGRAPAAGGTHMAPTAWPLRERHLAFAMGAHKRLGERARGTIGALPTELVDKILVEASSSVATLASALATALHPRAGRAEHWD
jgi:hypothetical protein